MQEVRAGKKKRRDQQHMLWYFLREMKMELKQR